LDVAEDGLRIDRPSLYGRCSAPPVAQTSTTVIATDMA
jgi:hypothetical protein